MLPDRSGEIRPRRKRRHPSELRQRMLDAARQEFDGRGFAGATTATIAKRADVTEAQLFRYFPTKARLIEDAVFTPLIAHIREFQERVAGFGSTREAARGYIAELYRFLVAQRRPLLAVLTDGSQHSDDAMGAALKSLDAYFAEGAATLQGNHDGTSGIDPKLMVRVSFAAVLGAVLFRQALFPDELLDDQHIAAAVQEFVLDGIAPALAA